jgi:hypothetical protein
MVIYIPICNELSWPAAQRAFRSLKHALAKQRFGKTIYHGWHLQNAGCNAKPTARQMLQSCRGLSAQKES